VTADRVDPRPNSDRGPPRHGISRAAGSELPKRRVSTTATRTSAKPATLALALGGGGARGLAHVAVIEALDEIGIRPVAIAGTSVGAAIAALYASGMTGKTMRRMILKLAHDQAQTLGRVWAARASGLSALFSVPFGNPILLDAEKLCAAFLPPEVPEAFSELKIPLIVLATNFHERCAVPFTSGALKPAIAASMAVPGLLRPVALNGRILIDGAAVDPLPFQYLEGKADVILAVDVSGVGKGQEGEMPDPWECLVATLQIMGRTILEEKLRHRAPDILIRPNIGTFRMLDFFRASAIFRAADPIKDEVKRKLAVLSCA
jgi:NTE family protein